MPFLEFDILPDGCCRRPSDWYLKVFSRKRITRMLLRLLILFSLVVTGSIEAKDNPNALPFDEAVGLHWTNIAIGLEVYGEDYDDIEPYTLIQKLPDDRWLLSEQPALEGIFSKPVTYISKADRDSIVTSLRKLGGADGQGFSQDAASYVVVTIRILGHASASAKDEYRLHFSQSAASQPELSDFLELMESLKLNATPGD
ncbi:MAG: hypothetical protein AAF357_00175 [Verrucomicrobiota bacterium]